MPHLCTKTHGKIISEPDVDEGGRPILGPRGKQTVTSRMAEQPICCNCGRSMVRPPGPASEAWYCLMSNHVDVTGLDEAQQGARLKERAEKLTALSKQLTKPGTAIECGG